MNFQMFKLVLEKVEEPEIKLPTSTGSSKKQESSKIMASHPITSWQIDGETVETVADFILEGSKITVNIYFCFIHYDKAFDCVDHYKLWKILKETGISDHLICLLRNLCAGQEVTVRTGHGITDWFQIGKGVRQGCVLSPCLFNFYAEYIMRNARLDEA